MAWQDKVISSGQVFFVVALVPTIMGVAKPPLGTSVPTAAILGVFAWTFWTLRLRWSCITSAAAAVAWAVIALQVVAW